MIKVIIVAFLLAFAISSFFRCFLFNLHNVFFYSLYDVIYYLIHKEWRRFNDYGIDMYVGMFGHGKTLSMTHRAKQIYDTYGDSIRFVSNYKLYGIPYVPLVNFTQLTELGKEDDEYQATVVLIDEIEDLLSHRAFASFPLQLLNVLTQQRKKHVYIMCSAQRFFMVDKIFRSITTNVIDCNKFWRFQSMTIYDAWDYENAVNSQLLGAKGRLWWFVKNKDFNSYSTEEMISQQMSADFISNEEHLTRVGLDHVVNESAIRKPSRSLRKTRKNTQRK